MKRESVSCITAWAAHGQGSCRLMSNGEDLLRPFKNPMFSFVVAWQAPVDVAAFDVRPFNVTFCRGREQHSLDSSSLIVST